MAVIKHGVTIGDIVYPNDLKAKIKVDADLKEMFRRIELPRDMVDIGNELQKNGMKPVMSTHASILVDSVGPPRAEVCRTAASFP